LEKIRNQSFSLKSIDDWKEKAEQSLKGKTVETLQSSTYENIVLKPLYTREDEQRVPDYPGGADFRRGIFPLGYITNEWKIAQQISYDSPEELKDKLQQAFDKGQSALSFEVNKDLLKTTSFSDFLTDLYKKYPFAINTKWLQHEFLSKLAEQLSNKENVTGYIANDPISLFAKEGFVSEDFLQTWLEDINQANEIFPCLQTVLIDTNPYHNGGANAVQELGIAAAVGVFYLQRLLDSGIELETALTKMLFQFSIGSNFFMELAKLRAARVLWNRITELYGADKKARGMHIAAATSAFTKTVYDPHVNLLRAANEAFAAVLGGVQYLHVAPFDELTGSNTFSERIARNVQLILKEESHLQKVIDPAGGSWYIETLTNQLAEMAWDFFQQIDARGGIVEVLKSGWLQGNIATIYEKRNKDSQTRKQSIVGTNVYAKLDESAPNKKQLKETNPFFAGGVDSRLKIASIPQRRLAEPFEELRNKAKLIESKTGSIPAVGMLCLGELKQHKARLDFMKGFLAAGGVIAQESKPLFTIEDAKQFVSNLATPFICFCGTNEQYETMGHELLIALKAEFPNRNFFLAGLPEKANQSQWMDEGITQFIHIKSNCYETVSAILSNLEVSLGEESKA
jgi:methylmalonyl-CoA mutase